MISNIAAEGTDVGCNANWQRLILKKKTSRMSLCV
jgi:hypothetical protein